ncbi:MAG: glycoside hydrolase [Verrucomicrobiae bacterium]|nr:glycoside hydrolase [Verrucomicrobiae bacterium]
MPFRRTVLVALACGLLGARAAVIQPDALARHVQRFNTMEPETVVNAIPNQDAWAWMEKEIPLFECPDREVEEMYYFRWWSFRKHLVETPVGYVITEFLTPVGHAGAFNTISCAVGHHLAEGRWLRSDRYLDDTITFWLRGNDGKPQPHFHKYSNWFAAAVWDRFLVNGDRAFVVDLLPDLVADYRAWVAERRSEEGLFWQYDVRDGMEESISGSRRQRNLRPTINSYLFANARAIADIAGLAGKADIAREFTKEAERLKTLVRQSLWDPEAHFFKVRLEDGRLSNAREEIGFIPWMFHLPDPCAGEEDAWAQLTDPDGFAAPFGITTAERRHPRFRSHGYGTCEWDGAVWPFATSQTLTAMANVLCGYLAIPPVTRRDYFSAFLTYTHSQHAEDRPYIGEYLDEITGEWINGRDDRSRYYNHSTYADLLISGLVGLRPCEWNIVEIAPSLPPDAWDWFCLDGLRYHGRLLTVVWDRDGSRYHVGAGLSVMADGEMIGRNATLERLTTPLP